MFDVIAKKNKVIKIRYSEYYSMKYTYLYRNMHRKIQKTDILSLKLYKNDKKLMICYRNNTKSALKYTV